MRSVVADPTVDLETRGDAALILGGAEPGELTDVLPVILRSDGKNVFTWMSQVRGVALLGADVVPELRALVADRDVGQRVREKAALVLGELSPEHRDEAVAELRAQARDEFLEFTWRTDAMLGLAELDPETLDHAVAFHRTVLDDERQPVEHRAEAAYRLVQLEPSLGEIALAALRRFATSPEFGAAERETVLDWFRLAAPLREHEIEQLALALARDPAASTAVRSALRVRLEWRARLDMERSLLTDRTAAPHERVGDLNAWQDGDRSAEAVAVLRDLLTAPDTTSRERVEAAAALGRLAPRHVPEAAEVLEKLGEGRCEVEARDALAAIGRMWSRRVLADVDRVFADETRSWRRRAEAAVEIWDRMSDPPDAVADHLRQLVDDTRLADTDRVDVLYSLRRQDGLERLRELRDDVQGRPATRWSAANLLRREATTDRAAGARVLAEIAANTHCHPALRWRAARDLTDFGERGRERGVAELRAISADESMPVIVRVDSLSTLGSVRPDLRAEVLRSLRELRTAAGKPLALLQVHQAIGFFDSAEGTRALYELARDGEFASGVRLRAARAMAELRADHRERAAVVARDVMHDEAVHWHIRVKAARSLARWSELCRDEALEALVELGG